MHFKVNVRIGVHSYADDTQLYHYTAADLYVTRCILHEEHWTENTPFNRYGMLIKLKNDDGD